jgi:hypothetical protein
VLFSHFYSFLIIKKALRNLRAFNVRLKGVEPPHLAAPDPKSGVSTNSTTAAEFLMGCKYKQSYQIPKKFNYIFSIFEIDQLKLK